MVSRNYLGRIAGPSAVFSGYSLLFFGALTLYFSLMAIPLLLLGGIFVFSTSEVLIDDIGKYYKYRIKIFGFLSIGSFKPFQPGDEIQVKHVKGKYITYSRSNRQSSLSVDDYRVYLREAGTRKKILMGKFNSEEIAYMEARRLKGIIGSAGT